MTLIRDIIMGTRMHIIVKKLAKRAQHIRVRRVAKICVPPIIRLPLMPS